MYSLRHRPLHISAALFMVLLSLPGCGQPQERYQTSDPEAYAGQLLAVLNDDPDIPGTFSLAEVSSQENDVGEVEADVTLNYQVSGQPGFACKVILPLRYGDRAWLLRNGRHASEFETPGFEGSVAERNDFIDMHTRPIRRETMESAIEATWWQDFGSR